MDLKLAGKEQKTASMHQHGCITLAIVPLLLEFHLLQCMEMVVLEGKKIFTSKQDETKNKDWRYMACIDWRGGLTSDK